MKNFIINKQVESELLIAILKLTMKKLGFEIREEEISDDWFLDEEDEVYEVFDTIYAYIMHNDYVSENTMQRLNINGTSDLVEFYYEYNTIQ